MLFFGQNYIYLTGKSRLRPKHKLIVFVCNKGEIGAGLLTCVRGPFGLGGGLCSLSAFFKFYL